MGEYQVIARKWRPARFSEVIGQEHLTRTLKNAVKQSRIAHAYLFVGPRGIGKTTTARIFAKALNCENPQDGEPCCKCQSCVSITNGNNMDVIEIDAASQNSVQSIRDLCEEVMFSPVKSKYKVYIVDEVHMLQATAWNAFLKTIEEPPAHAKFIFATTEAHKVLPTIISRCQRFDLRRIPSPLIFERLRNIAEAEKVDISPKALEAIARAADGGMRDAQSLLDQMISFFSVGTRDIISEEQVLSLFGLTAFEEMEKLVAAIIENRQGEVITNIHHLAIKGKNLEKLFEELLFYLRGIQLCGLIKNPEEILETGAEAVAKYRETAQNAKPEIIQKLLEQLSPAGTMLHNSLNKQVYIETIILKAMRIAHSVTVDALITRLNMIRKADGLKIIDEVPPAPQPQTVVRIETISDNTGRQDKKNIVAEPTGSVSEKFSKHQTPHDTQQSEITEKAPSREQEEPLPEQEKTNQPGLTFTDSYPDKSPVPAPEAKNNNNETENPRKENIDKTADTSTPEHPHGDEIKKSETPPTPAQSLKTESSEKDKVIKKFTHSPGEAWHLLMKDMENQLKDQTLKTYMAEGFPVSFENNTLTIAFDDEFSPEHIEIIKKRLNLINKRFSVISGLKNPEIKITHREGAHDFHEQHSKYSDITELKERVQSNSFVKNVMEVFNGKIVDIHG